MEELIAELGISVSVGSLPPRRAAAARVVHLVLARRPAPRQARSVRRRSAGAEGGGLPAHEGGLHQPGRGAAGCRLNCRAARAHADVWRSLNPTRRFPDARGSSPRASSFQPPRSQDERNKQQLRPAGSDQRQRACRKEEGPRVSVAGRGPWTTAAAPIPRQRGSTATATVRRT